MSGDEHLISQAGGDGCGPRMTPAQLDAIQARAGASTEGPWEWDHGNPRRVLEGKSGERIMSCAVLLYPEQRNAEFIAHARADVLALLALVRGQAAKLEAMRELAEKFQATQSSDIAKRDNAQFDLGYSAGRRAAGSILRATLDLKP